LPASAEAIVTDLALGRIRRWLLPQATIALLAAPAAAQQPASAPAATTLHLTQSAERRVVRDRLHVALRAEKTAADPQTVEAAINQAMAAALAQAKQAKGIEVETGSYSVYRETPQNGPAGWSGSQLLLLTGKDAGPLLKLAGTLQSGGFVMSNLAYETSPDVVHAAESDLTAEALSQLGARAETIARQLHLSVLGYRDLTVGNVQNESGPVPRVMSAGAAAMPEPVAAPGEATVRVTVSAEILLGVKPP
jgi:uncharacterized protein